MRRVFAVLLAGGLLMGSAHAADRAGDAPPSLSREDAERLRATEQACRELIDSAALLGERLQEVGVEMQRLMAETGAQLGREMAPAMRQLAERLNEMARALEQPRRKEGT
jgi:predicted chitinase